jgi:hypothetical protein
MPGLLAPMNANGGEDAPRSTPHRICPESPIASPSRRVVLAGMVSAFAATLIPGAGAETAPAAGRDAFLALSAIIAGPRAVDGPLARRLFDALQADDPSFAASAGTLLNLVNEQHLDSSGLQQVLDAGHPELAALPRRVASAWFMGIVGKGEKARCVAYESALGSVIVADRLRPPTYAYGPYSSWAAQPA